MKRVMLKLSAESALRGGKVNASNDNYEGAGSSRKKEQTVNRTKLAASNGALHLQRKGFGNFEKIQLSVESHSVALEEAVMALPPNTSASDSLARTVSPVNSASLFIVVGSFDGQHNGIIQISLSICLFGLFLVLLDDFNVCCSLTQEQAREEAESRVAEMKKNAEHAADVFGKVQAAAKIFAFWQERRGRAKAGTRR